MTNPIRDLITVALTCCSTLAFFLTPSAGASDNGVGASPLGPPAAPLLACHPYLSI
jgi:hypothetical protein